MGCGAHRVQRADVRALLDEELDAAVVGAAGGAVQGGVPGLAGGWGDNVGTQVRWESTEETDAQGG